MGQITIGRQVKFYRSEVRVITMKQLAEKIGVTEGYISMIESGSREPSMNILRKLARALKVEVNDLLMP